jgi:hypothetical protein
MASLSRNGNGRAEILPPAITKTITGQSLVHRQKLDKRQRAVLAADVVDGMVLFIPT